MGLKSLIRQFLKFGVVGVISFVIDYAILMLLSQVVGWDPVVSSAISFTASVVFNYVASMRYVFVRREDLSRERGFVIFVVLSIVGLGINSAIIWAGTQAFGGGALAVTITKVMATIIVALWNFWSRKRWLEAK